MLNSLVNLVAASIKRDGELSGPVTIIADAFRLSGCSEVVVMVASIVVPSGKPELAPVQWELIDGDPVTNVTSDGIYPNSPLNAVDPEFIWAYPSAIRSDRTFRLWVNRGNQFEDWIDIVVSSVPRSFFKDIAIPKSSGKMDDLYRGLEPGKVTNLNLIGRPDYTSGNIIVPPTTYIAGWTTPSYLTNASHLEVAIRDGGTITTYDTLGTSIVYSNSDWDFATELDGKYIRVTTSYYYGADVYDKYTYEEKLSNDILPSNINIGGFTESKLIADSKYFNNLSSISIDIKDYQVSTINSLVTPALESTYNNQKNLTSLIKSNASVTIYEYSVSLINDIVTPTLESSHTKKATLSSLCRVYYDVTYSDYGLGSLG